MQSILIALVLGTVAIVVLVGAFVILRSRMGGGVQITAPSGETPSLYDLRTRSLQGDERALDEHRGKVALVVNVASKCGLTPQYEGLQRLHEEFSDRGFTVLGFPSNDFLGQEPGSPRQIAEFCSTNYGVAFPLYEKRHVKGRGKDEVFQVLTRELHEPNWNFTKYLLDRRGRPLARFSPRTPPEDRELRAAIERALEEPEPDTVAH